jgi:exodeoxyribonuclease V alpha subunit
VSAVEAVFDLIEQHPERLQEVTGIAQSGRPASSPDGRSRVIREIMLFLHGDGVGTSRAMRIYKQDLRQ